MCTHGIRYCSSNSNKIVYHGNIAYIYFPVLLSIDFCIAAVSIRITFDLYYKPISFTGSAFALNIGIGGIGQINSVTSVPAIFIWSRCSNIRRGGRDQIGCNPVAPRSRPIGACLDPLELSLGPTAQFLLSVFQSCLWISLCSTKGFARGGVTQHSVITSALLYYSHNYVTEIACLFITSIVRCPAATVPYCFVFSRNPICNN